MAEAGHHRKHSGSHHGHKSHKAHDEEPRTTALVLEAGHSHDDNVISTAKYTLLTFLPISLFEQFRRIANVYFLFIIVLMLIGLNEPRVFSTPLSPYTTLGPFLVILGIVCAKEGLEDWKRHASDDEVNNRSVLVVTPAGEVPTRWRALKVGQVVRVLNKAEVPADLILLQTSEPQGVCYIETANIDGETNLKLREAVGATADALPVKSKAANGHGAEPPGGAAVAALHAELVYEAPNDRIHSFNGKLRLGGGLDAADGAFTPLGARNMMLRGAQLRNTKWVLGVVVYAGRETKVMKKTGGARSKMSAVEKTMNTCIKIVFAAQIVLCSITTIAEAAWTAARGSPSYVMMDAVIANLLYKPAALGNWFTFLLLFNNFIPISLYVTVELVNFAQSSLVGTSLAMYDAESDTPARARTSTLNQDLGQIEYIFSDKTGTLTRNVMEFKRAAVAGRVFGVYESDPPEPSSPAAAAAAGGGAADAAAAAAAAAEGGEAGVTNPYRGGTSARSVGGGAGAGGAAARGGPLVLGLDGAPLPEAAVPKGTTSGFDDPDSYDLLRRGDIPPGWGAGVGGGGPAAGGAPPPRATPVRVPSGASFSPADVAALEAFWTCVAVCHTVVPEADDRAPNLPPVYQAESPDEAALTKAARDVGFEFLAREADAVVVRRSTGAGSATLTFKVLGVHEFNSTRKRMSVVVRAPDGRALLLCKGADNVMFERARLAPGERAALDASLTTFAEAGLRTLVMAQRALTEGQVAEWAAAHAAAAVALTGREDALAAVAEAVEKDLVVLGASAVEDKLQEGVPGTIRDLRRAGINTWVLTGDKVETAINIGFSSKLLDSTMEVHTLASEEPAALRAELLALEARFRPMLDDHVPLLERWFGAAACGGGGGDDAPGAGGGGAVARGSVRRIKASRVIASGTGARRAGDKEALALVVTGPALVLIIGQPDLERAFLTAAQACKSVVACRVSPQQKAAIVNLVRRGLSPRPMTLAIGDGANDVSMIQRADVGVGISGKEGLQAANAADFSIAQFRFLRPLLLVHGRWDYRRMCKVVLYSFYKNVVITLTLFYYNALTGFSGTSFYESLVYTGFNFVLGLPIIFVGITDRDVSAATVLAHPSLYVSGLKGLDLNARLMSRWIALAVAHSLIVFWLPYGVYANIDAAWSSKGLVDGFGVAGWTSFSCLVWGMQLTVSELTLSWTYLQFVMLGISMVLWYLIFIAYSALRSYSPEFYGVMLAALTRPAYYLSILFTLGAQLLLDATLEAVRLQAAPKPADIARELEAGLGAGAKTVWGDEVLVLGAAAGKAAAAAEAADAAAGRAAGGGGAAGAAGAGAGATGAAAPPAGGAGAAPLPPPPPPAALAAGDAAPAPAPAAPASPAPASAPAPSSAPATARAGGADVVDATLPSGRAPPATPPTLPELPAPAAARTVSAPRPTPAAAGGPPPPPPPPPPAAEAAAGRPVTAF